jgi:uncharacterized membrane protein HdeD (DUF308 family)
MELAFPWPTTNGEWLAWASAAFTVLFGLALMFAPGLSLRLLRLHTAEAHPEAIATARATMAGFYLGAGLCALLLAQPFIYMTLGVCWLLAAFGRVVSMLSDRGNTVYNWAWVIVELVAGALPLGFSLGLLT